MCRMLYIGADTELPLVSWNENEPGFHVTELAENDQAVKTKFRNEYIYYASAYEGCGCGFQLGEYPHYEDEEVDLKIKSLRGLADYLEEQLKKEIKLELYGRWDGDQSEPTEHQDQGIVSPDIIRQNNFYFKEKEYLNVRSKV